ncbi:MAG: dTDP-4-dehydrorhamnose 3,5-epimerase [Candidatus Kerfeldbacteria bacterium]|nr:dTDP-4-dehydrorhamnose 3,5-epimerase [Candidatus Kerfeldbacteria bacterium]
MKITPLDIPDLYCIELELREDERGYFARSFCQQELAAVGIEFTIRQMNRSLTRAKGTIRGMHFQQAPKAEAKMVTALRGRVFDVAVDVRPSSPTYGKWVGLELSADNKKIFYIPEGFAHGFQTLEPDTELQYLMSEFYSPEHARGVLYNDPLLNIAWPLPDPFLVEKDLQWPLIDSSR